MRFYVLKRLNLSFCHVIYIRVILRSWFIMDGLLTNMEATVGGPMSFSHIAASSVIGRGYPKKSRGARSDCFPIWLNMQCYAVSTRRKR